MKKLILIFLLPTIFFSQNRYDLLQIIKPDDGEVIKNKSTMEPINGVVFCKWGDIGEYINGKPTGIHRTWNNEGQIKNIINYSNKIYSCEAINLYSFLSAYNRINQLFINDTLFEKRVRGEEFNFWDEKKFITDTEPENGCFLTEQTRFKEGILDLAINCLNDECNQFTISNSSFEFSFFRKNDKRHIVKKNDQTIFGLEKKWNLNKVDLFWENGQIGYSFHSGISEEENNKEVAKD